MIETLKRKRQEGFTLVELLIVIVIIAILAALVIVTFSGVQARARNTERQTDIAAMAKYLEVFYADNSRYPQQTDITGATQTTIKTLLPGFDVNALIAPQAASGTTNSYGTSTTPATSAYGYVPAPASCTTACTSYTLYWNEENGGVKSKTSSN